MKGAVNTFVNCTNHEILIDLTDSVIALSPSGYVTRVIMEQIPVDTYDDVPVYKALPAIVIKGLPSINEDNVYIVSATVAKAANHPRIVCPNHAPNQCTRDHHGRIVSVKSFLRYV